jgi:stress response protein YsnF
MYGHNVVAVYASRSVANAARGRLINAGIPESDIRMSAEQSGETTTTRPQETPGFFDWLFGNVPPEHKDWYASNLGEHTALSVHVRDEGYERVFDLLEEFDPVDIDGDEEGLASAPTSDLAGSGAGTVLPGTAGPTTATTAREKEDQVIPLSKEEMSIGKRETERRYRIRTYVVERPVEEQVNLRDERVIVERHPVASDRPAAEGLQEREFEVVERHEEPVVAKNTRATEEVVVHKDVKDRVETVRDTVRETKVDVDQGTGKLGVDRAAAGAKPGLGSLDDRSLYESGATEDTLAPKP